MLHNEISGVVIENEKVPVMTNYIYGLGGRDMTIEHLRDIFRATNENAKAGKRLQPVQTFVNLRGPKLTFFK